MPYGIAWPDGPKSGCRNELPASIEASHCLLRRFTGRWETSACQTSFFGKTWHFGAPGGGTATETGPGQTAAAIRATPTATPILRIGPGYRRPGLGRLSPLRQTERLARDDDGGPSVHLLEPVHHGPEIPATSSHTTSDGPQSL